MVTIDSSITVICNPCGPSRIQRAIDTAMTSAILDQKTAIIFLSPSPTLQKFIEAKKLIVLAELCIDIYVVAPHKLADCNREPILTLKSPDFSRHLDTQKNIISC